MLQTNTRVIMTNKGGQRAEFSPKIRELIAKRAGYRCSFPGCGRTTIGPAKDPHKSSDNGIAAHIYSAATSGKGPRGTGGLSDEELRSSQNAIWLCRNHAGLVDENSGEDYPPEKLHNFKILHETRIERELTGINAPFGWVENLKVHSSPLFSAEIDIEFAKLTVIVGGNSVGKTALCEWIAGHVNPRYLERWSKIIPDDLDGIDAEVRYHDPDPHCSRVSFQSEKYPRYYLDENLTVIPTVPLKVIFPEEIRLPDPEEPNDLVLISRALNLHQYEILSLCEDVGSNGTEYVKEAWFEEEDEDIQFFVKIQSIYLRERAWFRTLSGSERARVLIELGILAAKRFSVMYPTLLLLDSGFCRLDTNWLKIYAEFLSSPTCQFQTIVFTRSKEIKLEDLSWVGWKVVRLYGEPPNVKIRTGVRE